MTNEMDQVIELITTIGKISAIGPDDDIHDAGFSSILRLQLRMELEDTFNVMIPDDDRFPAARTPRALHGLIQELVQ
jgi:acyl carrier protein